MFWGKVSTASESSPVWSTSETNEWVTWSSGFPLSSMDFQSREEEICSTALCCGWSESLRRMTFPVAAKPCVAWSICAFKSYCLTEKALRSRACRGSADSRHTKKRSFKFRVSSFKQYLFCMAMPIVNDTVLSVPQFPFASCHPERRLLARRACPELAEGILRFLGRGRKPAVQN